MLALGATVAVAAQSTQAPASNAILISQTRSGNTVVSHYKIPHNNGKQAEFDFHYAVNNSEMTPSFSDNLQQVEELKDFMEQTKDTTMHISSIHIVGYASPDGNPKQNDTLAAHRAQSLYHYAVNTYHPAQVIDTKSKAYHWHDCVAAVEKAPTPNKEQVLAILKSTMHTEAQKEAALRELPEAWSYLASYILPQMRYADIEFDYGIDEFVTRTSLVEQPTAPAEQTAPAQTPQPQEVVVDEEVGIIIATPKHDGEKHHEKKDHSQKSRKEKKRGSVTEYEVIYW